MADRVIHPVTATGQTVSPGIYHAYGVCDDGPVSVMLYSVGPVAKGKLDLTIPPPVVVPIPIPVGMLVSSWRWVTDQFTLAPNTMYQLVVTRPGGALTLYFYTSSSPKKDVGIVHPKEGANVDHVNVVSYGTKAANALSYQRLVTKATNTTYHGTNQLVNTSTRFAVQWPEIPASDFGAATISINDGATTDSRNVTIV